MTIIENLARAQEQALERHRSEQEAQQRLEAEQHKRREEFIKRMRTLEFLRTMEPLQFQALIWIVYRRLGYTVQESPAGRDGGVDGVLSRYGKRIVLQCKRYQGDVGEPVVRDLYGTMLHHSAQGALLVTTGRISSPAEAFAKGKTIELIGGDSLLAVIAQANIGAEHIPEVLVTPEDHEEAEHTLCPVCGRTLQLRKGRHGKFYGCRGYPSCSYTRSTGRPKGPPPRPQR
jgi:restriction system protein